MFHPLLIKTLGLATAGMVAAGAAGGALPDTLPANPNQAAQHQDIGGDDHGQAGSSHGQAGDVHGQSAQHRPGSDTPAGLPTQVSDPADDGDQRPQNHGFFVSGVARGITTTVPGVTLSASPKNHGEQVRGVAQSDAGKSAGQAQGRGK